MLNNSLPLLATLMMLTLSGCATQAPRHDRVIINSRDAYTVVDDLCAQTVQSKATSPEHFEELLDDCHFNLRSLVVR
jgi:hypothetical protein